MDGSPAGPVSKWAAVCAAVFAMAACGQAEAGDERPCTEIGAPSGLRVAVASSDAAAAAAASLRVCWDGACRDASLDLVPQSVSVPMSCDGEDPDAVCSASASPDGSKGGFAPVEGLPKEPVRVVLALRDSKGGTILTRDLDVTPEATYPNGEGCPEGGAQATLTVAGGRVTAG
ncbi:MAG: hypothetical protein FWJ90_12430 [Actinomadura sp.]